MRLLKADDLDLSKEVFAFELDDVLFPRQDYLLQVYYLFGSFYEFTEGTVKANDLALFMKKIYLVHGEDKVFDAAKEVFGIEEKYRENLERLQANAQIPLRLEIFSEMKSLLKQIFEKGKHVTILTKGNPIEQLNKLKFIDWGELDRYKNSVRIYFVDEILHLKISVIPYLAIEYGVSEEEISVIEYQ
ncbi:HAD family hydrolase [Sphingobacterium bovistauri]|uniref:HAD family hydrolase n=1 Tax=Sphingobacterium bovistauri TaxID=2781959 RepID=A0ABS7ZBD1_9SPHI|nr:HAD family hydrolase [Sphingobacterium bovistauri]MCA5006190.1 HAD family hydrolase [Sphingobacterium bovistauri]